MLVCILGGTSVYFTDLEVVEESTAVIQAGHGPMKLGSSLTKNPRNLKRRGHSTRHLEVSGVGTEGSQEKTEPGNGAAQP